MIERAQAGGVRPARKERTRNYEVVTDLVAERVKKSSGRITAKRLLPAARTAGYVGSDRNFRRLVAGAKKDWRAEHHRGRRPALWSPGEHLVIDWGSRGGVHVFCAVLAWSRLRFVRFAADEKSVITLGMLGECFAELGGAPQVVLVGRMGSLKAGVQTLGGCPVQLVVLLNPCRRTEATDETRRAVASTTFARGVVITLDRDNRDQIRDQDATGRSRTGRDGWDVAAVASAMNGDRRHGSGGMGRGSPCS